MFRAKVEVLLVFSSLLKKSAMYFVHIVIALCYDAVVSAVTAGLLREARNG